MKNEMKTNNKTVLLAIVAVFAMIAAGAAIVMASSESVDAADVTNVAPAPATISEAGNYYVGTSMIITVNGTTDAAAAIYVLVGAEVTFKGTAGNLVDITIYQVKAAPVNGTIADANIVIDKIAVDNLGSAENLTYTAKLDSANKSASTVSGNVTGAVVTLGDGKIKIASDGKLVSANVIENLTSNAVITTAGKITYLGDMSESIALAADGDAVSITSGTASVTVGANEAVAALTAVNGGALVFENAEGVLKVSGTLAALNSITVKTGSMTVKTAAGLAGMITGTTAGILALADNDVVSADITAESNVIRGYYTAPSKIQTDIKILGTLYVGKALTFGVKNELKTILLLPDASMDVWSSVKGVGLLNLISIDDETDYTDHMATVTIRQGATFSGMSIGNYEYGEYPEEKLGLNVVDMPATNTYTKLSGNVTGPIENGVLMEDLTIPEGATVTVTKMLALNGGLLTVNGTLIIEEGAQIGSTNAGTDIGEGINAIKVGSKGKIVNNGTLGKDLSVAVGTSATSYVELNGVYGLGISVSSSAIDLSGDITMISDTLYPANIETAGATITKDLTVPKYVTLNIISATLSSTLDVKGTVILGDVESEVAEDVIALKMKAGAVLNVTGTLCGADDVVEEIEYNHGQIAAYVTEPGKDLLSDVAITTPTAIIDTLAGEYSKLGEIPVYYTTSGYTIEVVKYTYIDENGDSMYYQRAEVSGSLVPSVAKPTGYEVEDEATFALSGGFFFINSEDKLAYNSDAIVALVDDDAYLIVEGEISSKFLVLNDNIVGAHFIVGGASENPVYYIVDYNAGLLSAVLADDYTITIVGLEGYKFDLAGDYSLPADCVIESAGAGSFVIPEGVSFTVMAGATLDPEVFAAIDGRLIVMADGVCDNVPEELYAVYSEDAAGNMKYCGFQTALNDAVAGETISVVRDVELDSLTVPTGVTVEIEAGTFAIKKSLIVSNDAKFITGGNFNMGTAQNKNSKVTVYGTLDATSGNSTFIGVADYEMVIESTGNFIYKTSQEFTNTKLVGAVYKDGTYNVLTTLDNAIEEGATAITIAQDYNSSAPIELDGVTLTINADTKVTLGTVDVAGGSIVILGEGEHVGKLTAIINGTNGVDEAATVTVTSFTGSISDKAKNGAYTMSLDAMTSGSLTVTSGTLVIGAEAITVAPDQYLTVATDAELINNVNTNITNRGALNVAGTLAVFDGTLTVTTNGEAQFNVYGILDVDGAMVVNGTASSVANISGLAYIDGQIAIGAFNLYGAMYINDDAESTASATFNGNVMLGESSFTGAVATLDGKNLNMDATHYILAFAGAEVDDQIVEKLNLKTTEFYINGTLYATAYGVAGNAIRTVTLDDTGVINANTVIVVPGYNMDGLTDVTNWKDINGVKFAAIPNIGAAGAEAMFFEGEAGVAEIVISVGTGMSIYVDGVKRFSGAEIVGTMGAHTVSVTVDPGYKYADGTTATITFNGKVLSGLLTFEVTPDMVGKQVILSAIGDIVVDQPDIPEQEKEDNTVIMVLLAVLVVMVVILAIVVILRMMRS